jgi:LacI family transcriptional regulator
VSKVTIYEVATRAGVSISTVSQALNRPDRVNPKTRTRVLDAIEELGYVPKAAAVSHARKGVGRIGVLAPFTSYDSYRRRLMGVLAECEGTASDVVVFDHESAAATVSPLLRSLPATGRLDGLLLMGLPLDDALAEYLSQRETPCVLVDSRRPEFNAVNTSDEDGGASVARHLLKRGHDSFAFVREPQQSPTYVSQAQRRYAGFVQALSEAGVSEDRVRTVEATDDVAGGREALRQIAEDARPPTAVFAHDDALAAGVVQECRSRGIGVPADMAVVGFDDSGIAEAVGLTTVRQPLEESGRLGARLLNDAIAEPSRPVQHILLSLELVVRETT